MVGDEERLEAWRAMLGAVANATICDKDGNLPFFLSFSHNMKATGVLVMTRVAATQEELLDDILVTQVHAEATQIPDTRPAKRCRSKVMEVGRLKPLVGASAIRVWKVNRRSPS